MVEIGSIWKVRKKNRKTLKLCGNDIYVCHSHLKCLNTVRRVVFINYGPHEHEKSHKNTGKHFYSPYKHCYDLSCDEKKSACRKTGSNRHFRDVWHCQSTFLTCYEHENVLKWAQNRIICCEKCEFSNVDPVPRSFWMPAETYTLCKVLHYFHASITQRVEPVFSQNIIFSRHIRVFSVHKFYVGRFSPCT